MKEGNVCPFTRQQQIVQSTQEIVLSKKLEENSNTDIKQCPFSGEQIEEVINKKKEEEEDLDEDNSLMNNSGCPFVDNSKYNLFRKKRPSQYNIRLPLQYPIS